MNHVWFVGNHLWAVWEELTFMRIDKEFAFCVNWDLNISIWVCSRLPCCGIKALESIPCQSLVTLALAWLLVTRGSVPTLGNIVAGSQNSVTFLRGGWFTVAATLLCLLAVLALYLACHTPGTGQAPCIPVTWVASRGESVLEVWNSFAAPLGLFRLTPLMHGEATSCPSRFTSSTVCTAGIPPAWLVSYWLYFSIYFLGDCKFFKLFSADCVNWTPFWFWLWFSFWFFLCQRGVHQESCCQQTGQP